MSDKGNVDSEEQERKATAARLRFEKATSEIASEHRFGGSDAGSTEIELMEAATRLVQEARKDRH
ncbi:hypothetical protein MZK49_00730 [Ensifer sesbaniae]|uniref:hypothetical protein n=1 Tax=Ensifer sesbaniae TaxID=1214071 RepID=UPI0020016FD9|nr:hypothetical protein [Ensifer sesbaniae]